MRIFLRGSRLVRGLLASLALMPVAAQAQQPQQRVITMPALDFAKLAIEQGQLPVARRVLEELAKRDPKAIEPQFLLAEVDKREGNFQAAADRYRAILQDNPGLTRVRLELAAALFELKDDVAAEYNFRLALASDPPEAVRVNITRFIGAIRARKRYDFNIGVAIAPDTNINAGSGQNELTLFGLPFTLDTLAREKSGVGFTLSAAGEYRLPLDNEWRFRTIGSFYRAEYPAGNFDDMITRVQTGLQRITQNWDFSVSGVFTKRWFGNEPFQQGLGPRLDITYNGFDKWSLASSFEFLKTHYQRQFFRDGDYFDSSFAPVYFFSTTAYVRPLFNFIRERDQDASFSFNGYRFGVGYHQELPLGITAEIQPEYILYDYKAPSGLFGTTRRDRTSRFILSAYKRDWNLFGFSPTFTYIFTNNDSNQQLFEFRRHQFQIGITQQF